MAINRALKIKGLKSQTAFNTIVQTVLLELQKWDSDAALLPIEKAVASRDITKDMWDQLPEEWESYSYDSIAEQTTAGSVYLQDFDPRQWVTLHLGYDVISFTCTLEASWQAWQHYCSLATDTFNCCIYPDNLEWYLIRAGGNLYPMILHEDTYVLKK